VGTCVGVFLLASAWAGSSAAGVAGAQTTRKGGSVIVSTRKVPGLGVVLVDGRGRTLYMFVPDKRKRVTCTGTCAAVWPPLKLPAGKKPKARGKARASLLGSDKDPAGGRVVTYKGWPLYLYVADRKPGDATGQALDLNGGLWYVLSPSGKVIRVKARHTSSGRGY
jgi:predicted lipoprotein with Yx(FWY)xxD motif